MSNEKEMRDTAAYQREWVSRHSILLEGEFIAEASDRLGEFDENMLKDVYKALVELVHQKALTPRDVYSYARMGWCLKNADAIVAYQTGNGEWAVNNCDQAVSEGFAKDVINRKWGFEASRIEIIGTPYHDTDEWQFIRFNCGPAAWLCKDSNIYKVTEG